MFPIRCYLIKMDELVTSPKWARRLHRVLRDLPDELADYKGLTRYRPTVVEWLSKYDDGSADVAGVRAGLNCVLTLRTPRVSP